MKFNSKIFDVVKGVYLSEVFEMNTSLHAHPAFEIAIAHQGTFSLSTKNGIHDELRMAIISENTDHSIHCFEGKLEILLIENHSEFILELLFELGINLEEGIYCDKLGFHKTLIDRIIEAIQKKDCRNNYDRRVQQVLHVLSRNSLSYNELKTNYFPPLEISESRISHLFKEQVGISIKKFLVWNNLRHAIKEYLNGKEVEKDLFSAFIENGFYDQPHFSRSYKSNIGLSPGKVYNSDSVQF